MADLETRVDELEKRMARLENEINASLFQIKMDVVEIKTNMKGNLTSDDLKNQLIEKETKSNSKRLDKLESNQAKLVWTVIGEVLALIGAAVIAYLKTSS